MTERAERAKNDGRVAVISDCGKYRYVLRRNTKLGPSRLTRETAFFLMLNPSTADATIDDNTIRKCVGYATRWGAPGIVVANLYAYRTAYPKELWKAEDIIGPENDGWLRQLFQAHKEVVCAWGADKNIDQDRVREVLRMAHTYNCRPMCLKTSKHGAPCHPLYLKNDLSPVGYLIV